MSRSDGDGASVASERFASARGDGSLRGLGGVRSTNTAKQFWTLVGVQGGLMLLLLAALVGLELLTPELYFTLSFIGLLALRTVFAPAEDPPQWWRRLNWAVRVGFLVLAYLVLQQSLELL